MREEGRRKSEGHIQARSQILSWAWLFKPMLSNDWIESLCYINMSTTLGEKKKTAVCFDTEKTHGRYRDINQLSSAIIHCILYILYIKFVILLGVYKVFFVRE